MRAGGGNATGRKLSLLHPSLILFQASHIKTRKKDSRTRGNYPGADAEWTVLREGPQKGGVPAAPSGTATLLRLSPNHRFYPRPTLAVTDFRHPRLSWLDGRCVQGPGTYSPRHGGCAITSESSFVESGCRLQSELRGVLGIGQPSPGSGPLYPPL